MTRVVFKYILITTYYAESASGLVLHSLQYNISIFLLECTAYRLLRGDFCLKLGKLAYRIYFKNRKYAYGLLNSKNDIIMTALIK